MEPSPQNNNVTRVDSARPNKCPRPASMKAFQQKKLSASSETVFCRLRSNAFSMNQKLSRAKQNILVKIEDLKTQKEDNLVTKNRINEIKASIATLQAEISQRECSLEDIKQNFDAFHEMFGSAETIFQKNYARLDAAERCVRKLESNSSGLSVILISAEEHTKKLQINLAEDHALLEMSTASRNKVETMLRGIKLFNCLIKDDIEELESALELITKAITNLQKEHQFIKDETEPHSFGTFVLGLSEQRITVLTEAIAASNGKLDYFQTKEQQLVEVYGNMSDLEQSNTLNYKCLNEMEVKLDFARITFENAKTFECEVTKSSRSILDQKSQTKSCLDLLTACIDKQTKELAVVGTETSEGFDLSLRLKKIEYFRETRSSFLWNRVKRVEKRISVASACVRDTADWLNQCNRLREHLNPSIEELRRLQVQLASEFIITTELIEKHFLVQEDEQKKLTKLLSFLSKKLHRVLHKEQSLSYQENNDKMKICVKNQLDAARVQFQFLQQKKNHMLTLCDNAMKKNAQLVIFIRNCERTTSVLSEAMRTQGETARQEQLLYEEEATRLKNEYEKKLNELKTKKIIEQFEREFYRTNEVQERELSRKAKQLEAMHLQKERQQKALGRSGKSSRQSALDGDKATSRLNGGRECPQPKPGSDIGFEKEPLDKLDNMRKKIIEKTFLKNKRRTSTSKEKKDNNNEMRRQFTGRSSQEVVVHTKNQIVSSTRHRRQAASDNKDTIKATLKTSSLELDPFAFS